MATAMIYLLKMFICSGVLFGYYRLALYNERFHQWNRFYLLAALILSVVVPLFSIPVFMEEEPADIVVIIASMPWNSTVAQVPVQKGLVWQDALVLACCLVSVIMIVKLIINVASLFITFKKHPVTTLNENVQLVLTQLKNAPFSFFNWLFWREDIDPASDNGQRMLTHELTHIREHHSLDKMFAEILLCVFWMNPFFWLMKRELAIVHEFIADQKAVSQHDGASLAAMILQAFHVQPANTRGLVNPFFSSQIKRRLLMITTSKEPKYSYLRRLSGLLLMIFSVTILAISIQKVQAQQREQNASPKSLPRQQKETPVKPGITFHLKTVTIETDTIRWNEDKSEGTAITKAGERVKIVVKHGNKGSAIISNGSDTAISNNEKIVTGMKAKPLYLFDGKEITELEVGLIDPNAIKKIDVLKGDHATTAYGEKGQNGVVIVTSKDNLTQVPGATNLLKEVQVRGYPSKALIVADGIGITGEQLKEINPDNIESINVLKGDKAVEKYGAGTKDGAIEITTKTGIIHAKIFTKVEQPAQFPGGENAWQRYMEKNLRYPDAAQRAGTEGIARLQFIVDENGSLSNIKLLNDPGNGIGEEAMRLIKRGPKWQPAVQNGRTVVYQVELSIPFKSPVY